MCTVSHCREILPGDYEYLRCERHRIQNRHHSKLKRVRDKEIKAVAYDDWAAAVEALAQKKEEETMNLAEEEEEGVGEEDDDELANGGQSATEGMGLPPAARGTRRTNHVCSIKVCHNLLSPSNPWKMCDSCRSRDREARKIKALRESGLDVDPLPPRPKTPPQAKGEKKTKKKKKKADKTAEGGNAEAGPSSEVPAAPMAEMATLPPAPVQHATADAREMPFTNPLLPEPPSEVRSFLSSLDVFLQFFRNLRLLMPWPHILLQ